MHTETEGIVKISIFIFSAIFLLLAGFILFIVIKYKQKQTLYYENLEKLKAVHKNVLLQSQIEVQEQTFANISREIHDNIGQKLALLKLYLVNYPKQEMMPQLAEQVSEIISNLRDISRSLNVENTLSNGLIPAIEFEIGQLQKVKPYEIEFSVSGEIDFIHEQREIVLIRIIQEVLQNIVKHSSATKISVGIEFSLSNFYISIADNGSGFIKEDKSGQGLKNINHRIKILGGQCEIISTPGKGVAVKLNIPMHYEAGTENHTD